MKNRIRINENQHVWKLDPRHADFLFNNGEISGRNFFDKPDSVRRQIKRISIRSHGSGINLVYDRFSVPASDCLGSIAIAGKVDIQSGLRDQPDFVNGSDVFFTGPMPQDIRRHFLFQFHINRNGVPLIGPDPCLVITKRLAFLGVSLYDFFQHRHVEALCLCNPGD